MRQLEFCRQHNAVVFVRSAVFQGSFLDLHQVTKLLQLPIQLRFFCILHILETRELLPPTDAFQYAASPWSVYCLGTSSLCKQDLATSNTGSG